MLLFLVPAVILAYLSSKKKLPAQTITETIITLPLTLPPVAVGIVLLNFFSDQTFLGLKLSMVGLKIPFTWRAVVLAVGIMSFPLIFRPAKATFREIDDRYAQLGRSLGDGPLRSFLFVELPLARDGILSGFFLGWSRAIGEFGCTIVLAGNIAGVTRTIPIAIFHRYQMGEDFRALRLALLSAILTLLFMALSNLLGRDTAD